MSKWKANFNPMLTLIPIYFHGRYSSFIFILMKCEKKKKILRGPSATFWYYICRQIEPESHVCVWKKLLNFFFQVFLESRHHFWSTFIHRPFNDNNNLIAIWEWLPTNSGYPRNIKWWKCFWFTDFPLSFFWYIF